MLKRFKICKFKTTIKSNKIRMFENVLDWEHLPHVHPTSFTSIKLLEKENTSLRCKVGLWPPFLGLNQEIYMRSSMRRNIWTVNVRKGFMKGLCVHSKMKELHGDEISVDIDFYIPKEKFYYYLLSPLLWLSYLKIYKEDSDMMIERQAQLDKFKNSSLEGRNIIELGTKEKVIEKLPFSFDLKGHKFALDYLDGKLRAYDVICPHMLRDLSDVKVKNGEITCPWHDYSFSLKTGCSRSNDLKLKNAPKILELDGVLFAEASL